MNPLRVLNLFRRITPSVSTPFLALIKFNCWAQCENCVILGLWAPWFRSWSRTAWRIHMAVHSCPTGLY
jgi:hypothetical protein